MIQNYVWNWHLTKYSIIHFMCNLVLFIGILTIFSILLKGGPRGGNYIDECTLQNIIK